MSLIFGINLSDRVYVASDTRVTHQREKGNVYKDCICKNVPLTNDVVVSAAGSTKLAGHLYTELKKTNFINQGINVIKQEIKGWAAKTVDTYLNTNPYASTCLILAGLDRSKKKKINGKKYIEFVAEFQKLKDSPMAMKDTVFKGLSAKPNQPNPDPELPVCDSSVIALISDPQKRILEVEEAEFGEFLTFGPKGFKKEDVPKTLFGQLEFQQGDIFRDMSMLTAFITSTAEQKKLGSVGGSVVVNAVTERDGVILPAGTVHRLDVKTGKQEIVSKTEIIQGKLFGQTESGLMVRLTDFFEYKSGQSQYFI